MGKVARDRTLQSIVEELIKYNSYLIEFYGKLKSLNTNDKTSLINAINEALNNYKREPVLELEYNRNGSDEYIECTYKGDGTLSASSSDTSITDVELDEDIVNIARHKSGTPTITVNVSETDTHFSDKATITIPKGLRFGYRIKESESDPYARVEYLYDAEGMTPAKMLTSGTFDYGDWSNLWFVKDNKPLMLNSDGTVAYYLNPNDYTLKEDGTSSDVSNTSFNGNAMAQMPLVWFKRYSENGYHYEIVSNVQYDDDYKAYAHTRADGSIAPFFFWSMFGGSGNASKIRSLADQARVANLTTQQEINGAKANGSKWYTHTWSQHEYIRTLLVLMGKSTDTQSVFGIGNCRDGSEGSALATGTLKKMGQFFGYFGNTQQVKVFHIEAFWGDLWDRTAGLINNGSIYVKMTPEGAGYRVTDTTGYDNTGVTLTGTNGGYISQCSCSEYGIIPKQVSGSGSTYYCDIAGFNNSLLCYLRCGASAGDTGTPGGGFTFIADQAPSGAWWHNSCGLSCEMPSTSS